jgi:hypothetical protein
VLLLLLLGLLLLLLEAADDRKERKLVVISLSFFGVSSTFPARNRQVNETSYFYAKYCYGFISKHTKK